MRYVFVLLILVFLLPVKGQSVYELKKSDGVITISKHLLIYDDKSASLELKDILKKETQGEFKKWGKEIPVFNVTWSTIWIKITFTTKENEDWLLYWGMPSAQKVNLYKIHRGKISEMKSGLMVPKDKRILVGNNFLFELNLKPGDTATYYLSVNDVGPMRAIVRVGTVEQFFQSESGVNFWYGAYYGIMMIMVLYNLFLYITGWKKVYIYYVIYVVATTIFIAFFSGYVNYFPDWFLLSFIYLPSLFPAIFGFFGLLFTIEFLNTKINTPKMHRVIVVYSYLVFIPLLLSVFGQQRLSVIGIQLLGLGFAYICLTTGYKVLKQGDKAAKFYVFGFGAYMMSLMTLILNDLIGTSSEFVSQQLLLIGSAIEAVMLSFAIGDKLNSANKEKHLAQAQALRSAQENEKLIREQNVVLEQKVKERTAEVVHQKEIIEEKQKEIIDSINYAKRLQQAILAPKSEIDRFLPDNFLLYKPKDIVAGDFYFFETTDTHIFYAAADCTGHGVPGAMVSIVCSNALTRCVKEFGLTDPGKILDKTREMILETFQKSGEDVKDGMDISLISIARSKSEDGREPGSSLSAFALSWAGANNPLWYIEKGEMKEIKANKQPIGKTENPQPFTTHELPLSLSALFLLTDGYADQFGGPKGKKFKYSNLQSLLSENSGRDVNLQSEILNQKFEEWKGDLEQVDDICIIGIKL